MLFSRKSVQRYCFFFIYTTETSHFLHFLFKYSSFLRWNGVFLVYFCQMKSIGRSILLAKRGVFLTTESHGITRNRRYTNSPSPVGQRFKLSKPFPLSAQGSSYLTCVRTIASRTIWAQVVAIVICHIFPRSAQCVVLRATCCWQ